MHADIAAAAAAGHELLIALSPVVRYVRASDGRYYPLYATGDDIRSGKWDPMLRALLGWLLSMAVKVSLRWCWEANLGPDVSAFYPETTASSWVGTPFPPTSWPLRVLTTTGYPIFTTPSDYTVTWGYVTRLARGLPGAVNLAMFYCPGVNDSLAAQQAGLTLTSLCPAQEYVDVIGYDSYNTLSQRWYGAADTLRGPRESDPVNPCGYDLVTSLNPTAPVWIGETACMEPTDPLAALRAPGAYSNLDWVEELLDLPKDVLPRLSTVCWFSYAGTRSTWPIDSTADALAAFERARYPLPG